MSLPTEIWWQILEHVSTKDLKSINQVSRSVSHVSRTLLWQKPKIPAGSILRIIPLSDLKRLPIRHLKWSQFDQETFIKTGFLTLVNTLHCMNLLSFEIDRDPMEKKRGRKLTLEHLKWLSILPITKIDTITLTTCVTAQVLIQFLHGLQARPEIIIREIFFRQLTIKDWAGLFVFPISDVYMKLNEAQVAHLSEYLDVVKNNETKSKPRIHIMGDFSMLTMEQLHLFDRINIVQLHLATFKRGLRIPDLVTFFQVNSLDPSLIIGGLSFYLSLSDLQLLFRFRISRLNLAFLSLNSAAEEKFISVIMEKHKRYPIERALNYVSRFSKAAIQTLQRAGIVVSSFV